MDLDPNCRSSSIVFPNPDSNCDGLHIHESDVLGSIVDEAALEIFSSSIDSAIVDDSSLFVESVGKSLLKDVKLRSVSEAFSMYRAYAQKVGFGVRLSKSRFNSAKKLVTKEMCCCCSGLKDNKGTNGKQHTKLDTRTNCKARLFVDILDDGSCFIRRHDMIRNHPFVDSSESYLLRSHREISRQQLVYMKRLKESGVPISQIVRILRKEAGGSPLLGFTKRDAYNALAREKNKHFESGDSNSLISKFIMRKQNEKDFYFAFELNSFGELVNFFWRDSQMKDDYLMFGDLVVHDTTYKTNKYNMVCGSFVGMNNHGKNVMFGCGFVLNENMTSFVWLFTKFLESMNNKCPVTVMTDQDFAMAGAIAEVFTSARHRLCLWHIGQNARKNLRALWRKKGFVEAFDYTIKHCETIDEFEVRWKSLLELFEATTHPWLLDLYKKKEKWCPTYNKNFFFGGILSSQRSESTNNAICKRITACSGLCDFYENFQEVISEWRSTQRKDNIQCKVGLPEIPFCELGILLHARSVYTVCMYAVFDEEYQKAVEALQVCDSDVSDDLRFTVWHLRRPDVRHLVTFNKVSNDVSCSCNGFLECGFLCSHCLRIYLITCVAMIPERYILKRWSRDICSSTSDNDTTHNFSVIDSLKVSVLPSVWRTSMQKKYETLICASEVNEAARALCTEAFNTARLSIEEHAGKIHFSDSEGEEVSVNGNIRNPPKLRKKGDKIKRKKSILEKKVNTTRARKRSKQKQFSYDKGVIGTFLMHGLNLFGHLVSGGISNALPGFKSAQNGVIPTICSDSHSKKGVEKQGPSNSSVSNMPNVDFDDIWDKCSTRSFSSLLSGPYPYPTQSHFGSSSSLLSN